MVGKGLKSQFGQMSQICDNGPLKVMSRHINFSVRLLCGNGGMEYRNEF